MVKKIFKYDLFQENDKWYAECPVGQVIRTDYVNDGFYKGNFVWIIVDPDDKNKSKREISWIKTKTKQDFVDYPSNQLSILERQHVLMRDGAKPVGVADVNGRFYLYYDYEEFNWDTIYLEIRGYKTGQEIDIPEEQLEYLGLCRLWMKQELAIYFFVVRR